MDRLTREIMWRPLFALFGLSLVLAGGGCVPSDIQNPEQRAAIGALGGATIGAAIGAAFAINPPVGAAVGAGIGGVSGAVIGATTAEPEPSYAPIEPPSIAAVPGFYDNWPPGYHPPPIGGSAPPVPRRG